MPETTTQTNDYPDGAPIKRTLTVDRPVVIITTSGDYRGNVNLNLSSVQINRVSDLFVKSDIAFLPVYNAIVRGEKNRSLLINLKDIAVVIPEDVIATPSPELRKDIGVTVKLKYNLGHLTGKVNLWGETQQLDRISDLLNFPGKRWLVLYDVSYKGKHLSAAIVNIEFISIVED